MTTFSRLRVAAGILRDADGRVLITERLGDTPFAGLWEFPGGKIRDGESPHTALCRELDEEIGIAVSAARPFMQLQHDYSDRSVAIEFYLVESWTGEAEGREGQRLRWSAPRRIDAATLLPADAPVLEALRRLQESTGDDQQILM